MNKTISRVFLALSVLAILSFNGCYYDNEEDLYLGSNTCDTSNVTYSQSVAPVFANYCNSCHSGSAPSGNISTDSYTSVKNNISRIKGAVNHTSGFSPMPQNGNKLSDCDLTRLDIWIRNGMPEN
jgi:hypothetical protein